MKPNIHPLQKQVLAQCVCNNEFYFYSSIESEVIHVEVCNKCHPCATGKQQVVTIAGRVESFNNRFSNFRNKNLKVSNSETAVVNKSSKIISKPVAKTVSKPSPKSITKTAANTPSDKTHKGKK